MDCLFSDKEAKQILIYAEELRASNLEPILYVAPDWDIVNSSWTSVLIPEKQYTGTWSTKGYIGQYYGMPVYVFDGLDSHMCCIMPNIIKQTEPKEIEIPFE